MKLSIVTSTAAVLFLAAGIPANAQRGEDGRGNQPQHSEQSKPAPKAQQPQAHAPQAARPQQQNKPSPVRSSEPAAHAKPQQSHTVQQQAHAAPARQQAAPVRASQVQAPQPQRSARQAQSWQQNRGWAKQGGAWQPHTSFQQNRDRNWAADHRSWSQRGGYGGSYIPQASFGIYFGSSHSFHIGVMPVMYMGYPRFAYGGYSFMLLDPWPGSWQENWYASDDVYIDYSDGYYLHDRRYPGVQLAITVAL